MVSMAKLMEKLPVAHSWQLGVFRGYLLQRNAKKGNEAKVDFYAFDVAERLLERRYRTDASMWNSVWLTEQKENRINALRHVVKKAALENAGKNKAEFADAVKEKADEWATGNLRTMRKKTNKNRAAQAGRVNSFMLYHHVRKLTEEKAETGEKWVKYRIDPFSSLMKTRLVVYTDTSQRDKKMAELKKTIPEREKSVKFYTDESARVLLRKRYKMLDWSSSLVTSTKEDRLIAEVAGKIAGKIEEYKQRPRNNFWTQIVYELDCHMEVHYLNQTVNFNW
jgi:hypothetical protein